MTNDNEVITETGTVEKIKGGLYFVRLKKTEKCNGCKICDFGKNNSISVPALSSVDCKVGDSVVLTTKPKKTYLNSIILYLLPIVVMIACAIISYNISRNDLITLISCAVGLFVSFILIFVLDKIIRNKNNMPLIVKNLSN